MNRRVWVVAGGGVLLIALVNVVLGMNMVPTMGVAQERGTGAGWWLIWIVIAFATACSVALAGFLIAAGLGKVSETAD